jgi:hypothetical protein
MPRRKAPSDKSKLRQGRGQGLGADDKPFITVRDFGSKGVASRMKSRFSGRIPAPVASPMPAPVRTAVRKTDVASAGWRPSDRFGKGKCSA